MRFPRAVRLSFSGWLVMLAAAFASMASVACLSLGMWPLSVAAIVLAMAGLVGIVLQQVKLHGRILILSDDGTYRWGSASAGHVLVIGSTDLGWAVWLRSAPGSAATGGGCGVMLLPDQMSADDWRALRIWIRHKVRPPCDALSEGGGTSADE